MFSFSKRRKKNDVTPHLRRLIDLSTAVVVEANDQRASTRYPRFMPVMFATWLDGAVDYDTVGLAFSTDIGDGGIGLLATASESGAVVIGAYPDAEAMNEPLYFLGEVRRRRPFCAGFWQLGVEITELLNRTRPESVSPLNVVVEKLSHPER